MDQDGYFEVRTLYRDGLVQGYDYDQDQDGLFDWRVSFSAGTPVRGEFALSPDGDGSPGSLSSLSSLSISAEPGWTWGESAFALPEREEDRGRAAILWEQYPAVLRVSLGDLTYVFSPWEFSFSPLVFTDFAGAGPQGGSSSFWYPGRNSRSSRLTTRTLVSSAMALERPSREFSGALERVDLARGIPQRAVEYLNRRTASSQTVSVTEFSLGRPRIQRVDLDLDGRMETIRYFRREDSPGPGEGYLFGQYGVYESAESDWDGDGIYETGEEYFPDGGTARSWDLDKDGFRDYRVILPGNDRDE
jgi:hypothetical protein